MLPISPHHARTLLFCAFMLAAVIYLTSFPVYGAMHEQIHAIQCQLDGGTPTIKYNCTFTGYNFSSIGFSIPATNQTTYCTRCDGNLHPWGINTDNTMLEAPAYTIPFIIIIITLLSIIYMAARFNFI